MATKNFDNVGENLIKENITKATGSNKKEGPGPGRPSSLGLSKEKKAVRLNCLVSPETASYIRTMALLRDMTYSAFLDELVAAHMEKNHAIFEEAKKLTEKLKN